MPERKRDYKKEYRDFHGKPEEKKRRAGRNAARAKMVDSGSARKGDGKDVHHVDHNTANNSRSNLRVISKSANRSKNTRQP